MFESQQNISKNKQSKKENFSKKGEEQASIDIAENESENKVVIFYNILLIFYKLYLCQDLL